MNTARAIVFASFILLAGLCLLAASWTHTPYGRLDLKIAVLLKYLSVMQVDLFEAGRSMEEIRAFSAKGGQMLQAALPEVEHVQDRTVPGPSGPVPVRIYSHAAAVGLPIVIYCHGGGWVLGGLDSHDNTCRAIAKKAGVVVLSPDYGLAPEAPYPSGLDDVYAALVWAVKHAGDIGGDPAAVFLAGDSAGGNLAAATALRAKALNGPAVTGQILIYPAVNLKDFNTASYGMFSDGYYLTRRYMERFRAYYVPNPSDRLSPLVSPLLASDFKGLPPALVVTAQFDVLRDEGEAYARQLKQNGVAIELIRVKGVIHGFLKMDRILTQADDTVTDIAAFIHKTVSSSPGRG